MSVIVKGLDLPAYKEGYKNRYVCLLVQNSDGITDLYVADKKYPVSTVPTPHGRLIDAEKAAHSILMMSSHPCGCSIENVKDVVEWLRFVNGDGNNFAFPTIIEAEVSEE